MDKSQETETPVDSSTPITKLELLTTQPAKNLFVRTNVPAWMQPPKKHRYPLYTEWTWDQIITRLSGGETLKSICDDETFPEYGRLQRFIHHPDNKEYLEQYHQAQMVAIESDHDDAIREMETGADKFGNLVDIDLLRERNKYRMFLAKTRSRDRYGDKKEATTTVHIDLSLAMEQADKRVSDNVVDGEVV